MTSFQFRAVQVLDLTTKDSPVLELNGDQLTLTATRGAERIVINATIGANTDILKQSAKVVNLTPKKKKPHKTPNREYLRGESHPKSKLTEQDIHEIRELFNDTGYRMGFSSTYEVYLDLGKTYKVHYTTIYKVINGSSWKHVGPVAS